MRFQPRFRPEQRLPRSELTTSAVARTPTKRRGIARAEGFQTVDRGPGTAYLRPAMESIRLTTTLTATPEDVYEAWITGKTHAEMTGSGATSEKRKGGTYTAWAGYISGKYLELDPGTRVLQTWRTTEFPESAPDSRLEVRFAPAPRGTQLTLLQSGIPDGQGEMYTEGWQDNYFDPMSEYFRRTSRAGAKKARPAKKKAKAKPKPAVPRKAARKKTGAPTGKAAKKAMPAAKKAPASKKKAPASKKKSTAPRKAARAASKSKRGA